MQRAENNGERPLTAAQLDPCTRSLVTHSEIWYWVCEPAERSKSPTGLVAIGFLFVVTRHCDW